MWIHKIIIPIAMIALLVNQAYIPSEPLYTWNNTGKQNTWQAEFLIDTFQ